MILGIYSREIFPDKSDSNSMVCFSNESERFVRFSNSASQVVFHQKKSESLHGYMNKIWKIKKTLEIYLARLEEEHLFEGIK